METESIVNSWNEDTVTQSDSQTTIPILLEPSPSPSTSFKDFTAIDYCLFFAMLAFSALIGIYFAFFAKKKQNTTAEYLMGGKTMGIAPVSMSLVSSYVSGITLLGMPAEIYTYGTQYCTVLLGLVGASIACGTLFMPVFYKLQLNTSYEYLEIRFDRRVRILGSVLYLISSFLYIPIVIYVPALASSQVTGINIHLITPVVCLVCIFYTSLGGLKAVVWTDTLQTTMMFGAVFVVVVIGTNAVGGAENVWERNENSGRIEFFNFDLNPTIRYTFWNTAIGSAFMWCNSFSVNQSMVQRFLCMSSIKRAQIVVVLFSIGIFTITGVSFYVGMLIYASYYNCDLVAIKAVRASDQLLPFFVMDVSESFPGLPGLFMAGVFSAALSSMSTGLNSMSGVIYEDFIRPCLKKPMSEARASFLMKIICVIIGVLCVCMVFIVEQLGAVLQVTDSLAGVTSGPTLAIFVMGMFFPWANAKGTLIGGIAGLVFMGYIAFGTQAAISNGQIKFDKKPLSVDGCSSFTNNAYHIIDESNANTSNYFPSPTIEDSTSLEEPFPIFLLSYILYSILGLAVTVAVSLLASFITGPTDPADVHIDLLSPVIHPLFKHRCNGDDRMMWEKPSKCEATKEEEEIHNLLNKRNQADIQRRLDDENYY